MFAVKPSRPNIQTTPEKQFQSHPGCQGHLPSKQQVKTFDLNFRKQLKWPIKNGHRFQFSSSENYLALHSKNKSTFFPQVTQTQPALCFAGLKNEEEREATGVTAASKAEQWRLRVTKPFSSKGLNRTLFKSCARTPISVDHEKKMMPRPRPLTVRKREWQGPDRF